MVEIEFDYEQSKKIILADLNDSFETIIHKFIKETNIDLNKLFFLYNKRTINKKEKIANIINNNIINKIVINAYPIEKIIKSYDIICPKCKESCLYEIKNYRIKLSDCKKGHIIENIKLNEFDNTQFIDISKIICGKCKNKSDKLNKDFYICLKCDMNLCSSCKLEHEKEHSIIFYENRNYICKKHNEKFNQYCCDEDICDLCYDEHYYHEILKYEDELNDIKDIRKNMNELRKAINKFKNNIEDIFMKLKKVMEYMDLYYNINNNILSNYEMNQNLNYNRIISLVNINSSIKKEIDNIKNKYNFGYNINRLLYLYNQMIGENNDIDMIYEIKENNKKKVRIFGEEFVNNNKEKCKIIYDNNEYDLKEFFEDIDNNYNNQDLIRFELKGVNNITDMSYMFYECDSILLLPSISNINTSKVFNMSYMFKECNSLISLPDISKWNTENVTDMRGMFYGCNLLSSLPDISKWNISNVNYLNSMFYGCNLLSSLPDISKWDVSNVIYLDKIFYGCCSLLSLPDLSKWNISNAIRKSCMYDKCIKLDKKYYLDKKVKEKIKEEMNEDFY